MRREYYEITASVVAKDEAALATAKAAMDSALYRFLRIHAEGRDRRRGCRNRRSRSR